MTTIKITANNGCIEDIIDKFQFLLKTKLKGAKFKFAEIHHDLHKIPMNPESDDFYPLRLHGDNDVIVMVSEVRCGHHGASSDAMLKCLEMAGFNVSQTLKDKIYNRRVLNTLVWGDGLKQY